MPAPPLEQIGPYPVIEFVAEGGMAWVFKVRHPNLPLNLALKLLKPDAAVGDEVRLFEREAQLLATIQHPNLVRIYDFGQDEATGSFYYTMEYIEGANLSQRVARYGPLSATEANPVFMGILKGLQELHDRNIVHRDIKPSNIMTPREEHAVLMDLGIARVLRDSDLTQYTRTDVIRGTPLYMSPEQSEGKAVKPSSDTFSVGLSLYYVLTGRTAYDDVKNVDTSNPHSVRSYLGHLVFSGEDFEVNLPRRVPRRVRNVVQKACCIKPEKRYQNAGAMALDLEEALKPGVSLPLKATAALAVLVLAVVLWGPGIGRIPDAASSAWNAIANLLPGGGQPAGVTDAGPGLNELAAEAYSSARAAWTEARAGAVDLPEYSALMARGDEALRRGEEFEKGEEYGAAQSFYNQAKEIFAETEFVGPAHEARKQARSREGEAVQRGLEDLGPVREILAKADLDYAEGRFRAATEDYQDAIRELKELIAQQPNQPPMLLARRPEASTLQFRRNERVTLSVEAEDPDEDELRYAWKVDGKPHKETGPSLHLRPSANATVEARISDALGNEIKEGPQRWRLAMVNRKPSLAVSPGGNVPLKMGQTQTFQANANDPDGDSLTMAWIVDGTELRSTDLPHGTEAGVEDRYPFEARAAGSYQLVARVTDTAGASVSREINITVTAAVPTVAPKVARKNPCVDPNDPRQPLLEALQTYETAFESCDVNELEQIWMMGANEKRGYRGLCDTFDRLSMSTKATEKFGVKGEEAWMCFHQSATGELGGSKRKVFDRMMTGQFLCRPDGWHFRTIQPECQH